MLQAWREVDDALTVYPEAQRRRAEVPRAGAQDKVALGAARQHYAEGIADFLNVNSAEAHLLQAQVDLADGDTQVATDLVSLSRTLGGGWGAAEAAGLAPALSCDGAGMVPAAV